MHKILLVVIAAAVSGCANLTTQTPRNEWYLSTVCPGTRAEDPQTCKGETWDRIPNPPRFDENGKAR